MTYEQTFALKGNLVYAAVPGKLTTRYNAYLVCSGDQVAGIYDELPERWSEIPVTDYQDQLILPGLVDLHTHAPQFAFRGMGMDMELLQWLEAYPFREEARYSDFIYANQAYDHFTAALTMSGTTRAVVFATIHSPATLHLMEMLSETGLQAYVGKVSMDRNCPIPLREKTKAALEETEKWIRHSLDRFPGIRPILTPRFVPSCSEKLMEGLGALSAEYNVPIQSHLSENRAEVHWVEELHPGRSYAEVYDQYGLLGKPRPCIMAHCVYCTDEELDLMKSNGVFVAHCPQSNTNLASGIAPVRRMMRKGLRIGLGTDVAGGFSLSIFRAMADAIQVSKLRWAMLEEDEAYLTVPEVFYMATKGGGAFWGKVGSFEPGYAFDALVMDDSNLGSKGGLDLEQRLERIIYLSDDRNISAKYVAGQRLF